jgi:hypothetical protein
MLFLMSIIVAELRKESSLGQRASSNQIQSQHCTSLHAHHRRRAKDKDAHWLTTESKIQSDSKPTVTVSFFTVITVIELQTRKLIGSCQRARSNQIQSQHFVVLHVHHRRRAKDKGAHWFTSEQDPIRFKANTVPFFVSITIAELKTRKFSGSRRRARFNRIQSRSVYLICLVNLASPVTLPSSQVFLFTVFCCLRIT